MAAWVEEYKAGGKDNWQVCVCRGRKAGCMGLKCCAEDVESIMSDRGKLK